MFIWENGGIYDEKRPNICKEVRRSEHKLDDLDPFVMLLSLNFKLLSEIDMLRNASKRCVRNSFPNAPLFLSPKRLFRKLSRSHLISRLVMFQISRSDIRFHREATISDEIARKPKRQNVGRAYLCTEIVRRRRFFSAFRDFIIHCQCRSCHQCSIISPIWNYAFHILKAPV